MNYKVNSPDRSISGTCFQGYLNLGYDQIVAVLGETKETDGYKTDAEWIIEWEDGTVATLYNYKDGKNYNGDEGLELDEITEWHIGGADSKAEEYVNALLKGMPSVSMDEFEKEI